MKTADLQTIKSLKCLAEYPDLQLAIIFGSGADGNLRFDSDIDIAVYPEHSLDSSKRQQLSDAISEATGRTVDLIDLSITDGALLRQILSTGKILFSKNPSLLGYLTERILGWQEDFEPQINQLFKSRISRFTDPVHGK